MKILEPTFQALAKSLSRYQKRALLIACDLALLSLALWLAMTLRYGELYVPARRSIAFLQLAVPMIAVALFFWAGLYRHVTRHFNATGDKLIAVSIIGASLCLGLGQFMLGTEGVPRTVLVTFPIIGFLLVSGVRRLIGRLIVRSGGVLPPQASPLDIRSVVIYGAGKAAVQLIEAVRRTRDMEVVGIIDPDPTLWRRLVSGIRVHPPAKLAELIKDLGVSQVLLATQQATRSERLEVLNFLNGLPVDVRVVPQTEDIIAGRMQVSDLRRVEATDLLGRAPVPPDPALMEETVDGKSILVTGAGGSIGSEIVRQILKRHPQRVVLLEASESALYEIESQVAAILRQRGGDAAPQIVSVLGSVLDDRLMRKTIADWGVQSLFHAAAYKHLPIVERNIIAGALNNVIGTEVAARAAAAAGVAKFVLISTDKAVRPSSVMGASKRVAELMLQALALERTSTTFSIVRFGNVLDSSGSVVPLFRKQIETGGPLTVTHPDAVRFFISIPEAAELVIQAGAMAAGGEVFALDMGEPVRIADLARMMIRLSGLQLKDAGNPDGQIEIKFTGLRPGEKLAEELYISDRISTTQHPRIQCIEEPVLPGAQLWPAIELLKKAIAQGDAARVKGLLFDLAAGRQQEPSRLTG
ncbi:MAG: nucleoside-diphosphate sugar epimerase/dehydratase [Hyphomicrobiaceae bacterium]|nr:nucleoside-diphosphate sugar epimerase/dehydratase [Hyphomicrobiaceae bacterium]